MAVSGILVEDRYARKRRKEKAEEEPEPGIPLGHLGPIGAEDPEKEGYEAGGRKATVIEIQWHCARFRWVPPVGELGTEGEKGLRWGERRIG